MLLPGTIPVDPLVRASDCLRAAMPLCGEAVGAQAICSLRVWSTRRLARPIRAGEGTADRRRRAHARSVRQGARVCANTDSRRIAAACGRPLLYTLVGRAKQLSPPVAPSPVVHAVEPKWPASALRASCHRTTHRWAVGAVRERCARSQVCRWISAQPRTGQRRTVRAAHGRRQRRDRTRARLTSNR